MHERAFVRLVNVNAVVEELFPGRELLARECAVGCADRASEYDHFFVARHCVEAVVSLSLYLVRCAHSACRHRDGFPAFSDHRDQRVRELSQCGKYTACRILKTNTGVLYVQTFPCDFKILLPVVRSQHGPRHRLRWFSLPSTIILQSCNASPAIMGAFSVQYGTRRRNSAIIHLAACRRRSRRRCKKDLRSCWVSWFFWRCLKCGGTKSARTAQLKNSRHPGRTNGTMATGLLKLVLRLHRSYWLLRLFIARFTKNKKTLLTDFGVSFSLAAGL